MNKRLIIDLRPFKHIKTIKKFNEKVIYDILKKNPSGLNLGQLKVEITKMIINNEVEYNKNIKRLSNSICTYLYNYLTKRGLVDKIGTPGKFVYRVKQQQQQGQQPVARINLKQVQQQVMITTPKQQMVRINQKQPVIRINQMIMIKQKQVQQPRIIQKKPRIKRYKKNFVDRVFQPFEQTSSLNYFTYFNVDTVHNNGLLRLDEDLEDLDSGFFNDYF